MPTPQGWSVFGMLGVTGILTAFVTFLWPLFGAAVVIALVAMICDLPFFKDDYRYQQKTRG